MRQMWNKCKTLTVSFILDILLPLIFSVIFFGVIDFSALTSGSSVDLAQVFGQVRTNKSIFDLIVSMQNVLSLITTFVMELIGCIRFFNTINFEMIEIDDCSNNNGFFAKEYKEFIFNKANAIYLRI